VERGDYSAVVYADVDVAKLVHHCCCEDEVPEGGLDMTDLQEERPDWGFEIWRFRGGVQGNQVLEVVSVSLGDWEDGEL
jgi:hypothetical protein